MKNYITYIVILTALVSCSDFLEVEPDLQISYAEQLSTEQGVIEIVSGIYRDTEALASSIFQIYPDYMGGNVAFTPRITNKVVGINNTVDTSYPFQEAPTDSDYSSFFINSYDLVNEVNLLLEALESMAFLEPSEISQLKGELVVIRALTHYNMSLLFAQNHGFTANGSHLGIVYNIGTINVGVEFPSRLAIAQVYALLKDDLETANTLFTDGPFLPAGPNYSYFNKLNTQALYARIALQMNDWQTAANLSDQVILQSGLMLTPTSDYVNQWLQAAPLDEVLLHFTAPVSSDGNTSSSISAYYQYTNSINYGAFGVSTDLIHLMEPADLRNQLYTLRSLETLTSTGIVDQDHYFLNKYQEDSGTLNLRISEMYLIYAEAKERLTPGNTVALDRLNDVRERAGIARLTAPNDMLEEVFLERRRELAFENSLLFDIKRFKKDISRNQGCIAAVCNLSYPSNFYILPIPQSSILNNENMIQNEGY
jgi:hypothetical protein